MMIKLDVLIIGAGAAGLAAARELCKAGKTVAIIEARDRIGGRIHTLTSERYSVPVEAGAEFVHGDLPHTLNLLQESGIEYSNMQGISWQLVNGELTRSESFIEDWPRLIEALQSLPEDTTIAAFLHTYFKEDTHKELRESVISFVEGYDAADTTKASAFALRDEWTSEDQSAQYRLQGGYSRLMEYLQQECLQAGCDFHLSSPVREIYWRHGQAEVITQAGRKFIAAKALITVPLGVLQLEEGQEGAIRFEPPLTDKITAARQIGYGGVIKILLEFTEAFWEEGTCPDFTGRRMPSLGFLFSDTFIPTWWTQNPKQVPILTGWLAGPQAHMHAGTPDYILLKNALSALASLFNTSETFLKSRLVSGKVSNWITDRFALGAYSYATVQTPEAKEILSRPVKDTLFFAGEALYVGAEMGTVEAALASGRQTAITIVSQVVQQSQVEES